MAKRRASSRTRRAAGSARKRRVVVSPKRRSSSAGGQSRKSRQSRRKKTKPRRAASSPRSVKQKARARRQKASTRRGSRRPRPPALERERRRLPEEEILPSVPSTLNYAPKGSAVRSGHAELAQQRRAHTETGPALTGGDVDADWEEAYTSGEEAPGGENPTPDQDVVEEIGRALGVEYDDAEELKGAEKLVQRDRHRWELDPASADDYKDRTKKN